MFNNIHDHTTILETNFLDILHLTCSCIPIQQVNCRQDRRMSPCHLIIAFVPSKCPSRNLQFPHRVPLRRKCVGALGPFKNCMRCTSNYMDQGHPVFLFS